MAILITGGTGFIGSHTIVELLNDNRDVVVLDNFCNSKPVVLDRIREITGKDVKFYEADLLDYDALDKVFEENDIDSCIHFAGLKAVGESCAKPLYYYHNNINNHTHLDLNYYNQEYKQIYHFHLMQLYQHLQKL